MKISVDSNELYSLSEVQKKVIANDINVDLLESDLKRRLEYILMHKYQQCFNRLKQEWDPQLKDNGIESIPTDPDAYAEMIFALPNYKDRKTRDAEAEAQLGG